MALMYDTIMELPLFKGIGEDQLSQLLEKTSIEFLKYTDGEIIANAKTPVKAVDFIIKGKVKNTYRMENFPIRIEEVIGEGSMLGAMRLYGIDPTHAATITAVGNVSIMRIEKSQYMNILQSDRIYILNFVNYLAAAAQKSQAMMLDQQYPSIGRTLDTLAYSVASKRAESVKIVGSDEDIANYCGVSVEEFRAWKAGGDKK